MTNPPEVLETHARKEMRRISKRLRTERTRRKQIRRGKKETKTRCIRKLTARKRKGRRRGKTRQPITRRRVRRTSKCTQGNWGRSNKIGMIRKKS
jgi:sRNA-binding protein